MTSNMYKQKGKAVLRKVDQNYILIPISGSLSSDGALFNLNDTAADIFEFIKDNNCTSINEICKYISRNYDVSPEKSLEDIKETISILLKNNLIEEINNEDT